MNRFFGGLTVPQRSHSTYKCAYSRVPYAVLFLLAELAPTHEKQAQPVGRSTTYVIEGSVRGGASKTAKRRRV